jgi:hypothetical protein
MYREIYNSIKTVYIPLVWVQKKTRKGKNFIFLPKIVSDFVKGVASRRDREHSSCEKTVRNEEMWSYWRGAPSREHRLLLI